MNTQRFPSWWPKCIFVWTFALAKHSTKQASICTFTMPAISGACTFEQLPLFFGSLPIGEPNWYPHLWICGWTSRRLGMTWCKLPRRLGFTHKFCIETFFIFKISSSEEKYFQVLSLNRRNQPFYRFALNS